jgi:hypothetical protein
MLEQEVRIVQAPREILAGETPGEGFVEAGVALTEGVESGGEIVQGEAIIGSEDLALDD